MFPEIKKQIMDNYFNQIAVLIRFISNPKIYKSIPEENLNIDYTSESFHDFVVEESMAFAFAINKLCLSQIKSEYVFEAVSLLRSDTILYGVAHMFKSQIYDLQRTSSKREPEYESALNNHPESLNNAGYEFGMSLHTLLSPENLKAFQSDAYGRSILLFSDYINYFFKTGKIHDLANMGYIPVTDIMDEYYNAFLMKHIMDIAIQTVSWVQECYKL